MPAKSSFVNLLPHTEFEASVLGKFLKWSLSTGRYLIILTEMVVIVAFLSRFKLDKDLADLSERISGKINILKAEAQSEQDFRNIQARLSTTGQLLTSQLPATATLDKITGLVPEGMRITNINITRRDLTVAAQATDLAFQSFMSQVTGKGVFKNLSLSSLTYDPALGVKFTLKAEH